MSPSPRYPIERTPWNLLKQTVLVILILAWIAFVFFGLTTRGDSWPIFVILACIGPLVLVTVISIARATVWLVMRISERRERPIP